MRSKKAPLLLRCTSGHLRTVAFYRIYRGQAGKEKWRTLFENAPLTFAPGVDVSLIASDFMHAEIAFTGEYERRLSRLVVDLGSKGGTFVDVGANIGYFSLLWAASHPQSTVHAFEASPKNLPLLRRNVHTNNLDDQIKIYDCALGRDTGPAAFDLGPEGVSGWGGLSIDAAGANIVQVPVKRLDEVLGEAYIDLLKIDVEGADTWVLMGASELLRTKRIRHIWFEQNSVRMARLGIPQDAAQSFLRSNGYSARPMGGVSQDAVDWMAVPA
jgi:FkbM family methyltransferase